MKIFRTSARHLISQGIFFVSLLVFTMLNNNFDSVTKVPVLIIADIIAFSFLLSSIARQAIIDGDILTAKSLFRKNSVEISRIEYAHCISSFGRWVVIFNDGKSTLVLTSLTEGLDKLLDIVRPRLKPDDLKRIEAVTPAKIKLKKNVYDVIMLFLTLFVWYGIYSVTSKQ